MGRLSRNFVGTGGNLSQIVSAISDVSWQSGDLVLIGVFRMRFARLALIGLLGLTSAAAQAETISTHVLDLVRGVGGQDIPVTLSKKQADGSWKPIATARTDANGRVRAFEGVQTEAATYKLSFDVSDASKPTSSAFFPEIDIVFRIADPSVHYHVPVVLSPYGFSSYRGN